MTDTDKKTVEVKFGIAETGREVLVKTSDPDVYAKVTAALSETAAVVELDGEKGTRFVIPTARIAYVEFGAAESRRVGFGS